MDNWWKRETCASRNLWLFIPSGSAVLGQWLDHNQHSFGNLSLHIFPETCNCTLHPPWNFWVLWVWVSLSLLPCSLNVFHGSLPCPSSFHQSFDYLYNYLHRIASHKFVQDSQSWSSEVWSRPCVLDRPRNTTLRHTNQTIGRFGKRQAFTNTKDTHKLLGYTVPYQHRPWKKSGHVWSMFVEYHWGVNKQRPPHSGLCHLKFFDAAITLPVESPSCKCPDKWS